MEQKPPPEDPNVEHVNVYVGERANDHSRMSLMHANAHLVADVVMAVLNELSPFMKPLTPEAHAEVGNRAIDVGLMTFNTLTMEASIRTIEQIRDRQKKDQAACATQ